MITFEIHDLTVNEILADNLVFDDVPELFKAYKDLYTNHEIVFCKRVEKTVIYTRKIHSAKLEYQAEWFALVNENLCNFY